MHIESKEFGDTKLFHVHGQIAGVASRALFSELGSLVHGGFARIVLEISRVDYIDSLGLGTLIELRQMLRDTGKKLSLSAPNELVRELFWDSALEEIFEFVDPQTLPVELQ